MRTRSVDMSFLYEQDFGANILPDAYERLILDALHGDAALFTRSDEIELAWSLIDPIMQGWESKHAPTLTFYESGTKGPGRANDFIQDHGREWLNLNGNFGHTATKKEFRPAVKRPPMGSWCYILTTGAGAMFLSTCAQARPWPTKCPKFPFNFATSRT